MPDFSLIDIQQANGSPIQKKIVEDAIVDCPTIKRLPAEVTEKVSFNFLRTVAIPRGHARAANEGTESASSVRERHTGSCGLYETIIEADKAMADWLDTDCGNLMAREANDRISGMLMSWEYQLYYGKHIEGKGFDGFNQQIGDKMTISADSTADSAGTNKAAGSSVWFVREKIDDIALKFGKSRAINFGPVREGTLTDAKGKKFTGKSQDAHAWVGLAVKSDFAIGRIRNIDASHPLTDDLLSRGLQMFPDSKKPTAIYMNRYVGRLLQEQRTAKSTFVKKTSGNATTADWPVDYLGIPIIYTDGILNEETAANIAAIAAESMVSTIKTGTINSRETIKA